MADLQRIAALEHEAFSKELVRIHGQYDQPADLQEVHAMPGSFREGGHVWPSAGDAQPVGTRRTTPPVRAKITKRMPWAASSLEAATTGWDWIPSPALDGLARNGSFA